MVEHIGFIMDGNRRYAKKQNISLKEGYQKGMEKFLEMISLQVKYNIPETSFFALSNDNLNNRDKDNELKPLAELMKLFSESKDIEKFFEEYKIKINLIGDIELLNKKVNKLKIIEKKFFKTLQKKYEEFNNKIGKAKFTVNVVLNYGGQSEIVHAVKEIVKKVQAGEIKEKSINEKLVKENLWFKDSKPAEVIVRTGNSPRLSGFMLFDSQYSELYFTHKLWPEMDEVELVKIIDWYKEQERNFGK